MYRHVDAHDFIETSATWFTTADADAQVYTHVYTHVHTHVYARVYKYLDTILHRHRR